MAETTRGGRLAPELKKQFGLLGTTRLRVDETIIPVHIVGDKHQGYRFASGSSSAGGGATYGHIVLSNTAARSSGALVTITGLKVLCTVANTDLTIGLGQDDRFADPAIGSGLDINASDGDVIESNNGSTLPRVPNAKTNAVVQGARMISDTHAQKLVTGPASVYVDVPGEWTIGPRQCLVIQPEVVNVTIRQMCRGVAWLP